MATKYWTGAVDGDWSDNGNWQPSGAPSGGDHVIISGAASGSADIDAGTIALGSPLASLSVTSDYAGDIGTSDSALGVDVLFLRYHAQSGLANIAGELAKCSVFAGHDATLTLDGDFVSGSLVFVRSGEVTLEGEFGTVFVYHDKDPLGDSIVYNNADTSIIQAGGYVESTTPSDLRIFYGRHVYTGEFASDPVILQLGGEIEYNATGAALDTAAILFAGRLSTSVGNIPTSGNPIRVFRRAVLDIAGDYSSFASGAYAIERMGGTVLVSGISVDIGGFDL